VGQGWNHTVEPKEEEEEEEEEEGGDETGEGEEEEEEEKGRRRNHFCQEMHTKNPNFQSWQSYNDLTLQAVSNIPKIKIL
jgi:hypothetical protein